MINIKELAVLIATSISELSKDELNELLLELKETHGLEPTKPEIVEVVTEEVTVKEKETVNVILTETGASKLQAVKAWRELTGMAAKDIMALFKELPATLKENVPLKEGKEIKDLLENLGATITLQ